jgi:hypothetical protein
MTRKPPVAKPSSPESKGGLSPDPATNLLLAGLALRGGEKLVRYAVQKLVLGGQVTASGGAKVSRAGGSGIARAAVGTVLTRIATRSVPGAILVGGAMLAKTLHERRKAVQRSEDDGNA